MSSVHVNGGPWGGSVLLGRSDAPRNRLATHDDAWNRFT
jgi:hypothetical protein